MRAVLKSYVVAVMVGLLVGFVLNFTFDQYFLVHLGRAPAGWVPPEWTTHFNPLQEVLWAVIPGFVVGAIARPFPVVCAMIVIVISVVIDSFLPKPHIPEFFGDFFVFGEFLKAVVLYLLGASAGGYARKALA